MRPVVRSPRRWHAWSGLVSAAGLALVACSSAPPPPDWQMNAQGASERAVEAYLSGVGSVEASEFQRTRSEVARTGRPDLLARVELLRCAAEVASLVFSDCPGYATLAGDAALAEQAYARYLAGQAQAADAERLPAAHRGLLGGAAPADALRAIVDPLSRLVAAGVLMRSHRASPAVIELAVETASAQGWRRPLLAWLGVQRERADAAGDADASARVQRRMDLVAPAPKR